MRSGRKFKIAMVFTEQVYPGTFGASRGLMDLSRIFQELEGHSVRVFSLGAEDKRIREGTYNEEVVRSAVATNTRTPLVKAMDYAWLLLAKKQYTYYITNNNKGLHAAVEGYAPDYLMTVGRTLADFMLTYKRSHPRTKILNLTDDFRVVDIALEIRLDAARKKNPIERGLISFMSGRFRSFSWGVYSRMVHGFDAVSYPTSVDRDLSAKRFPESRGKFYVLPTSSCPRSQTLNRPLHAANRKVQRILFIGTLRHEANVEAVRLIESRIAPKLPDKRFIILGSGTERHKVGNVEYTGFVSEKEKFRIIDESDICIAPQIKGSGIKTKLLDYMMRCRPVIATSVALEGYPVRDGVDVILENDPAKYPSQILRLERDPKLRERLSRNCVRVCRYFSDENIGNNWDALLTKLAKQGNSGK